MSSGVFPYRSSGFESAEQAVLQREQRGGRAGRGASLGVDPLDVGLGGLRGDGQLARHLPGGAASGDQDQHLDLPGCEAGGAGAALASGSLVNTRRRVSSDSGHRRGRGRRGRAKRWSARAHSASSDELSMAAVTVGETGQHPRGGSGLTHQVGAPQHRTEPPGRRSPPCGWRRRAQRPCSAPPPPSLRPADRRHRRPHRPARRPRRTPRRAKAGRRRRLSPATSGGPRRRRRR